MHPLDSLKRMQRSSFAPVPTRNHLTSFRQLQVVVVVVVVVVEVVVVVIVDEVVEAGGLGAENCEPTKIMFSNK